MTPGTVPGAQRPPREGVGLHLPGDELTPFDSTLSPSGRHPRTQGGCAEIFPTLWCCGAEGRLTQRKAPRGSLHPPPAPAGGGHTEPLGRGPAQLLPESPGGRGHPDRGLETQGRTRECGGPGIPIPKWWWRWWPMPALPWCVTDGLAGLMSWAQLNEEQGL